MDKGLIDLGGVPMIDYVVRRLRPQVKKIVISANRNIPEYRKWSHQVVEDETDEFDGPLAGMASGLDRVDSEFAATVPCDSPLLARDLVVRMHRACLSENADIAVAFDGDRIQPVFAFLRTALRPSIMSFLRSGGRKIDRWFEQHALVVVDFSDQCESFKNVNTLYDREQLLSRRLLHE